MVRSLRNTVKILATIWPWLMDLWDAWGIQLVVSAGLGCQIFLALFGSRRRYRSHIFLRYVILGAYLFACSIVTIALGDLSTLQISKHKPDYQTELKALLAPLLLIQLGNPDNITAYSVEDNQQWLRLLMSSLLSVFWVIWILIRCLDSKSPISRLYIPLFIAGLIRLAETVWALKSGNNENISETVQQMRDTKKVTVSSPKDSSLKDQSLQQIVKAYYRFKCLRPQLENWLYIPEDISGTWLSLPPESTLSTFITTEVELAFVFDTLYTKAPILYTKRGLAGRLVTFLCLVGTLCRFTFIFKSAFLVDMYIAYTYALLISVIILEGYQIMLMALSEWALVMIYNLQCNRRCDWLGKRLLPFLSERCKKQKRWSNLIGQLNLLDLCLNKDCPQPLGSVFGLLKKNWKLLLRSYLAHTSRKIPPYLKDLLQQELEVLDKKRHTLPFDKRGEWTLEARKLEDDVHDVLWSSITVAFDKSIILWHLATEICYLSEEHKDSDRNCKGSKLLSDYMMYLLCFRPYALSLTSTDITMDHAYNKLKCFLRNRGREALLTGNVVETGKENDSKGTIIAKEWHVLSDAKKLAAALRKLDTHEKWEVMSSIWVEMLCSAAYNCQISHHAKMLREGGELITHVWLLLAHRTDKFEPPRPQTGSTSQDP